MLKALLLLYTSFLILLPLATVIYAEEKLVILRGDEDYPPHEMKLNSKLSGVHIDLIRGVAVTLGIKVQFKNRPWKRAVYSMQTSNEADAISYVMKTPEREKFLIYLEENILSSAEMAFLILRENQERLIYSGDIESFLRGKTLLGTRGSYGSIMDNNQCQKIQSEYHGPSY